MADVVFVIHGQEPRTRHPFPDHAWFRPRHGHWGSTLPAAEEGPEQTDDRRILGQQQTAVQQGCPGVSLHALIRHVKQIPTTAF